MLRPVLITAPTTFILTLAEAKLFLRVDYSDDDALIQALLDAVTAHYDGYMGTLGRAIMPQTWSQSYADFSNQPFRIRLGDLTSVSFIKYYDATNTQQTLDPTIYSVLSDEIGPYINLNSGKAWPAVYARDDAVTVQWICGFAALPADVKVAARLVVTHWYENRGVIVTEKRLEAIPMSADAIMMKYSRSTL